MSRIFAIGDVHGCAKTFRKLILEEIRIQPGDEIYCIGDYIDRGPDSKGVIDLILELRSGNYKIHTLRGNHEQMMIYSEQDDHKNYLWMINGGDKTLESFGIASIKELPALYKDFLLQTQYYIQTESYLFVHAGLNFSLADPFEDRESMLWIKDFTPKRSKLKGRMMIHGHTPKPSEFITSQKSKIAVNLDGGCVYIDRVGMGNLFALNLTEWKWLYAYNIDM